MRHKLLTPYKFWSNQPTVRCVCGWEGYSYLAHQTIVLAQAVDAPVTA